MKALKMFLLAVAITFSTVLSASTNPTKKAEPKTVSETVGELLKNPDLQLKSEVDAIVKVVLNDNNEMVVLNVDTDNEVVANFIKYRLNYKQLSKDVTGLNRSFRIPVKIIQTDY